MNSKAKIKQYDLHWFLFFDRLKVVVRYPIPRSECMRRRYY